MSRTIRLGCIYCDRNDCDRVDTLPSDWTDIQEVQSFEESRKPVAPGDPRRSVFDWETHLGVCPACQKLYHE